MILLEYYDKESDKTLKGFSQVDLEQLNRNIVKNNILVARNNNEIVKNRKLLWFLFFTGTFFVVYLLWLTWYIIHNNVINNIIGAFM